LGLPAVTTKGIKAAMGQARTFQIGFYSDKATTGAWTVTANIPAMYPGSSVANGTATVTIDKPTGVNGEKAYVTVTPQTFSGSVVYVELNSSLTGFEPHTLPLLIGSN